jgi:uncharacterized short protein YbdD (DUF466 family)
MICRCFGRSFKLGALDVVALGRGTRATALLMLGVPDYDAYVAHMRAAHPEQTPATRDAFFIARQDARYNGGGLRCC